nr:Calx-beta domain-containing protein [Kribbella sandramycini]
MLGRAVPVLVLLGGLLGAPGAQAAPPEPMVAQGKDWQVQAVPEGARVTLQLAKPLPVRDALPILAADGVPIGVARQSPDQRVLSLLSPDKGLLKAKKIELVQPGQASAKGVSGDTTDAEWLKAPQGPPLAVDPGAPGSYGVRTAEYDLGEQAVYLPGLERKAEVLGKVYTPVGATGKRPLVVFLHGRHQVCYGGRLVLGIRPWPCAADEKPIPSYRGYDGPAKALASHGYQVVSISANAVNANDAATYDAGAQARAELILHHLDLWKRWSTTGGGPFGRAYVGKIDLTNIGLMGHSRGGEGVARAAALNADRGGAYGVRAVLPLAPTDFARATVPGVAMSVILPYCDGDVSDLQGQKFFDDTRYSVTGDAAPLSTVTVLGTNHNFFNTEWTPGQSEAPSSDDWFDTGSGPCSPKSASRLTAVEQQAVGTAYIAGFFRLQLGRETALLPLLDGTNSHPKSAGKAVVRVVAQAAAATRRDLQRFDQELPAGAVSGAASARVCAGAAGPDGCVTTDEPWNSPHWVSAAFVPEARTTAVTKLSWTGRSGVLKVDVPAAQRDVRRYAALSFRAAPDPAGVPKSDLTVRVVDGRGRSASIAVSAVSDALLRLPGSPGTGLPKNLLRTVRIPTASLQAVDLRDVRSIELRTDRLDSGAVFLSDLSFSTPSLGRSAPTTLPELSASSVRGTVQEGDEGTQTVNVAVTLSRPSNRPVTVHAESTGDTAKTVADLTFAPGETRKQLPLTVTGNPRDSFDHFYVSLVLATPREAQLANSFGTVKVADDDPTPTMTINSATASERDGVLTFPATLSAPSDVYVYASGTVDDGTATIRQDYTVPGDPGTDPPNRFVFALFQPGQTTTELTIALTDDTTPEPTETLTVTLTDAERADIALPTTLTGTITDDD